MSSVSNSVPAQSWNAFLTPLRCQQVPNSNRWIVTDELMYRDPYGNLIVVPKGFVTDFASVPPLARFASFIALFFQYLSRFLWWMVIFEGLALIVIALAETIENSGTDEIAVIHDYLYATRLFPRWKADWILNKGMIARGATYNPLWKRFLFWFNVRLAGWVPWANDAKKNL